MTEMTIKPVRFTVPLLPGLIFTRYPIEIEPPEGTIGFVNDATWQTAGTYSDGAWRGKSGQPFKRKPTHWTSMEDTRDEKG